MIMSKKLGMEYNFRKKFKLKFSLYIYIYYLFKFLCLKIHVLSFEFKTINDQHVHRRNMESILI